jgi:two-component system NarL family sensor kinase
LFVSSRPRRALSAFLLLGAVALVVVSAGTYYLSETLARRSALAEAERTAVRLTESLVAPLLAEAFTDPARYEDLRRIVDIRLSDRSIASIVVWNRTGVILWASKGDDLVGEQHPPSADLLAALGGEVVATIDDEPEASYVEITDGRRMLEVYVPMQVGAENLVVEIYFGYDTIERQATLLRAEMVPVAVGSLLLLQLIQVPIAVSLVRRVRQQDLERADLLARSFAASERERRAIAGDVHDGPVQDLAGVSYALSALRASVPGDRQGTVDRLVTTVRDAVRSLRRLIVDIYPPDLSGAGLVVALDDVVVPLRANGLDVEVRAEPFGELEPHAAGVVYRTAKEALANVARHAQAEHVVVQLEPAELDGREAVRLEVSDDGVGIPVAAEPGSADGHLGLRLVRDRIDEVGGVLTIEPRNGGGTSLVAVVPTSASL